MSESYLVIKDRYLGISVTLRSGSRYEISMVEAAGAFATDALVGAVKRGVVGGGANDKQYHYRFQPRQQEVGKEGDYQDRGQVFLR